MTLGYRFEAGRRYVCKKSMKSLRDRIRKKTKRSCGQSLKSIISELNPMLRGWFEYFKHAYKRTFLQIDGFVRRRLRCILRRYRKKSKGTGRNLGDHKRWPNTFFAEQGLFTMKEAHVLACQSRWGNNQLESRVRENRTHGSEGGEDIYPSLPLSEVESQKNVA